MADLDYAKVVGRFALTAGDTTGDVDDDPDTIWCNEGRVIFTPLTTYAKVPGGVPEPFSVGNAQIEATIDAEGYLTYLGKRYVHVVDLTSPKVNPQIGPDLATHRVTFTDVRANGTPVEFPEVTVRLTAAGDVNGENDLTLVMPVTPGEATPIYQGPQGVGVETMAVSGGDLLVTLDDSTVVNAGALPVGPGGSDAGVASYINTPGTETANALSASTAAAVEPTVARASAGGSGKAPDAFAAVTAATTTMNRVLAIAPDGISKIITNGSFSAGVIGKTTDGTTFTWGDDFSGGNLDTTAFVPTPGGEVIVSVKTKDNTSPGTLRRSTGFSYDTMDATTWTTVLTAQATAANFDGRWGATQRSFAPLDSPGQGAGYFAEYNGDHVYETLDDGVTFEAIFDLQAVLPGATHVHAVAYDRWDDRVWITVGDTAYAGIYYADRTDIDGLNTVWTAVPGSTGASTWQATTVIPLAKAVVFLSDSPTSRVFRLPRRGQRQYGSLASAVSLAGVGLIGAHAYQLADDQPCYLTFYGPVSGTGFVPRIIATVDGERFSTVHTDANATTSSGAPGIYSIVGPDANGDVWFLRNLSGSGLLAKGNVNRRRIRHAYAQRSSGSVALNSTSFVDIDTGLDLTIAAKAGDVIECGLNASVSGGATYVVLDMVTVASGSPVNSITSGGAAPATGSHPTWAQGSIPTTKVKLGGRKKYVVQAGDVSSDGFVTVRLRGKSGAAVTVEATGDPHLYVEVTNLGQ